MTLPEFIHAQGFVPPRGYSDAAIAPSSGRLLVLGGHVAFDTQRQIVHPGELVPQVRQTLQNLLATLTTAGTTPNHIIKLVIHTPVVGQWRDESKAIGVVWREVLGKVYPAMTLIGVTELFDKGALVEIDGLAALPF